MFSESKRTGGDENMKKKEFTKFLALMMSAAMVAGSGVPVTAADFYQMM